jgi:hypothetical protein
MKIHVKSEFYDDIKKACFDGNNTPVHILDELKNLLIFIVYPLYTHILLSRTNMCIIYRSTRKRYFNH